MTVQEAKKELLNGKVITHWLFSDNEYIYISGGKLRDENRNILDFWEFFGRRQGEFKENFKDGWSIKEGVTIK